MKYVVKQRIMAFGKQYRVFDAQENQVFEVSSMLLSPERRKEMTDALGNLVAWSEWPMLSGRAELHAGAGSCELDIPFVSLSPEWTGTCGGDSLAVSGDFMRLSFGISRAGRQVASVEKRIFSFGDTYEVDVDEAAFPKEFALLIAALIDHKYHSEEGR